MKPAKESLVLVVIDERFIARGVQDAVLHIGVLDRDAEAGLKVEVAGVVLQPLFGFGDGVLAEGEEGTLNGAAAGDVVAVVVFVGFAVGARADDAVEAE